mmetsp:Transcript_9060/g.21198  ORF Transcript_9060/g.21198 Transcript_9060/m.21198 type:complete len:209 (-) Transcript_9060:201-827(-)
MLARPSAAGGVELTVFNNREGVESLRVHLRTGLGLDWRDGLFGVRVEKCVILEGVLGRFGNVLEAQASHERRPHLLLPILEILLDAAIIIALSALEEARCTERLQSLVQETAHVLVVLVLAVAKPKHHETGFRQSVWGKVLVCDPLVEGARVVGRLALAISRSDEKDEVQVAELFRLKLFQILNFSVKVSRLGVLLELLSKALSGPCL